MSRIPGAPDDKLKLLGKLDETSFPFLVADILHFCHGHSNVRVVDGPGDGRRDIHSIHPEGAKYLTQCKFHRNISATVSSRETDELPVALLKFGTKRGTFATTGRMSPPAKREYIENFPGFQLEFLEGMDIVDAVLSNPLLSAAWYNGGAIDRVRHALVVPFIIRTSESDQPYALQTSATLEMDKLTAQIGRSVYPQSQFRPYRPPNTVTLAEDGGSLLSCSQLELRGEFALHEVEALISEGAELLAALPEFLKENTLVLRFGNPLLAPAAPEEHPPTLPINDVASRSFVLSNGKALSEAEWVVFSGGKRWVFPEDLSVAEAPWAGWIGLDDNCVFMEELSWSKFHDDYFAKRRREQRSHALSRSLFMAGSTSACDAFLAKRDAKSHPPDVRTSYGIDGTLLGWLDPQAFDGTQSAFRYTASKDGPAAPRMSATPLADADRERLLQAGASAGLNTVPFGKARHYFAAEGMDLEFEVTEMVVDSAELFHNFDTIPSPTDLRKRACIFLWMWRVSGSPQVARAKLASTPLNLPDGADLYWDARRGSRSEKTFIMSTVALVPNAGETTDEFFIKIASRREKWALSIRSYLRGLWPKIELATIDFWKNEVGFVFDKGKVMGTPFAIFIGADGKRQVQILRKDTTSKMFPDAWKSKRRR